MGILTKLFYQTWNIGIVEKTIDEIILGSDSELEVNWVKHNYRDRFFADPFILDSDKKNIYVLVEEYPYFSKKGVISKLTIRREDYQLIDRKVILEQPYHMSYPFIYRREDGTVDWVAPEASMSGALYRYSITPESSMLENQELLLDAPLLDSTITFQKGKYWLFCTKRGEDSNKKLFIYHSTTSTGPWIPHDMNPVIDDSATARPAGYMVQVNDSLYRIVQKNDKSYGEAINVMKIEELTVNSYRECFIKNIRCNSNKYSHGIHTINGYDGMCVVDGLCREFAPLRRIWFELRNKFSVNE